MMRRTRRSKSVVEEEEKKTVCCAALCGSQVAGWESNQGSWFNGDAWWNSRPLHMRLVLKRTNVILVACVCLGLKKNTIECVGETRKDSHEKNVVEWQ